MYKKITNEWLNEASEDELKRIIIITNDGVIPMLILWKALQKAEILKGITNYV